MLKSYRWCIQTSTTIFVIYIIKLETKLCFPYPLKIRYRFKVIVSVYFCKYQSMLCVHVCTTFNFWRINILKTISFDCASTTCTCIWFMCSQCSHLYTYYHRWLVVNIWIRYKFKPWIKHIVHSSLHICCKFMFIVVHLLLQLYGIVYCEYLIAFLVKKRCFKHVEYCSCIQIFHYLYICKNVYTYQCMYQ